MKKYIGIDLGASSGRLIVGSLTNNNLSLNEIHRFQNSGIQIFDSLYWDILKIFEEIKNGLKKSVEKYGSSFDGIGLDTWGVDFVLLDKNDDLVGLNHAYRDKRTDGIYEEIFKIVSKTEIFNQTGIQFMQFNSLPQLFSMIKNKSPQLLITKTFLMIADYFNFLLSGNKCSEYTAASTSQLYDPIKEEWAYDLIEKLGFKTEWFPKIVNPGTTLGNIHESVANQTGVDKNTPIIASLCHDTASAIAACPVEEGIDSWAYISSGTWSLMGLELDQPLINEKVLEYNLTNEGGAFGTIRFLRNIMGLWLIQESKRIWEKQNNTEISYDEIISMAEIAEPFANTILPDHSMFLHPDNMIESVQSYCKETRQKVPTELGSISRTIFEGLAFRYRQVLEQLEDISGKKLEKIYIIGGGSQNELLCQFTSNAANLPVDSGPSEATAIGNILMQAIATREISTLQELREIVRNSFEIKTFSPANTSEWEKKYNNYLKFYNAQKEKLF
jgi:rhamnulokinase